MRAKLHRPSESIVTAPGVILDTACRLIGVCRFIESTGQSGVADLLTLMRQELEIIADEGHGLAVHFARTTGTPPPERPRPVAG